MSRSTTSTRGPASASKCSMRTARWKRSVGVALVGSGGLAGVAFRQTVRPPARLLRATPRIDTQWGPVWGPKEQHCSITHINRYVNLRLWRRGRDSNLRYGFKVLRRGSSRFLERVPLPETLHKNPPLIDSRGLLSHPEYLAPVRVCAPTS